MSRSRRKNVPNKKTGRRRLVQNPAEYDYEGRGAYNGDVAEHGYFDEYEEDFDSEDEDDLESEDDYDEDVDDEDNISAGMDAEDFDDDEFDEYDAYVGDRKEYDEDLDGGEREDEDGDGEGDDSDDEDDERAEPTKSNLDKEGREKLKAPVPPSRLSTTRRQRDILEAIQKSYENEGSSVKRLRGTLRLNAEYPDCDLESDPRSQEGCGLDNLAQAQDIFLSKHHGEYHDSPEYITWTTTDPGGLLPLDVFAVVIQSLQTSVDTFFLENDGYWRIIAQHTKTDFHVEPMFEKVLEAHKGNSLNEVWLNSFFGGWVWFKFELYNSEESDLPTENKEALWKICPQDFQTLAKEYAIAPLNIVHRDQEAPGETSFIERVLKFYAGSAVKSSLANSTQTVYINNCFTAWGKIHRTSRENENYYAQMNYLLDQGKGPSGEAFNDVIGVGEDGEMGVETWSNLDWKNLPYRSQNELSFGWLKNLYIKFLKPNNLAGANEDLRDVTLFFKMYARVTIEALRAEGEDKDYLYLPIIHTEPPLDKDRTNRDRHSVKYLLNRLEFKFPIDLVKEDYEVNEKLFGEDQIAEHGDKLWGLGAFAWLKKKEGPEGEGEEY